ncbi:MAG: N-formylglutamate amidohydrolase [Ramlibacter sp.]
MVPDPSSSTAPDGATAIRAVAGRTPLVFDSPHSGTQYPQDFRFCCDFALLRTAEDTHVEKLYDFAPDLGIAWVEALFPRSYLDANRNASEIDVTMLDGPWDGPVATDPVVLSKVRLGKGLIWKNTDDGVPLYDRPLGVQEVARRIERCWRPYYQAVGAAIDAAHARHGYSLHVNCHSMPAIAASHATEHPGLAHADFVVGDRDGTTADPRLAAQLATFLRGRGYRVEVNFPYKGVELVRRFGEPARHRNSVQLEVNRKLYMDERTFELLPQAQRLRDDLKAMSLWLLELDPRRL